MTCEMWKRLLQKLYTMNSRQRQHGWLMVEMVVALFVIFTLTAALTTITLTAGKGNRMLWARRQALAAAEAQLDCLTQSGAPLPEAEFKRLWPSFDCTIEIVAGTGSTAQLQRAQVTVAGRVNKKKICVTKQRYIIEREAQ